MSKLFRGLILTLVLVMISSLVQPSPVTAAAALRVTTTVDEYSEASNGYCSLREAIVAANENRAVGGCPAGVQGADTITLPNGIYDLKLRTAADTPYEGDLDITESLMIMGESKSNTIVRATLLDDRIFHVNTTGAVTFHNITIHDGAADALPGNERSGYGGGIYNERGTLTVSKCLIVDNLGPNAGGGISNDLDGVMYISESEIRNNTSKFGGGIYNMGTITIKNSLIQGNTANTYGGGFNNNVSTSKGTLINVTISMNQSGTGAGIVSQSDIEIINSTVSGNIDGEGLYLTGIVKIANTIVARHDTNCTILSSGTTFDNKGHNLEDGNDCHFSASLGDKVNTDPGMAAGLANNGGSTETLALLAGSQAINAAGKAYCPPNDQRGLFWSRSDGNCDIGAFEFGAKEIILRNFLPVITH